MDLASKLFKGDPGDMDHLHVPVSYIGGGGVQRDQYDRL